MFGKYNGFASKARDFCMHVFLVIYIDVINTPLVEISES
jgi:hypothetical protein